MNKNTTVQLLTISLVLVFMMTGIKGFGQNVENEKNDELYELVDLNPARAIKVVDSVLADENSLSPYETVCFLLAQSDAYYYNEQLHESTFSLYKALAILPLNFDPERSIELYNNLGQNLSSLGNPDSAIIYYQKGLDLSLQEKDTTNIATLYYNIGVEKMMMSNYFESLEYLDSAYQMVLILKDSVGIGSSLKAMGRMKEAHYDHENAIVLYKEALKYVNSDDPNLACLLNISIGGAFRYLNKLDTAEYYAQKASQCFEKNGDKTTLGHLYLLEAQINRDKGDTTYAIDKLVETMKWAEKVGEARIFYTAKILQLEIDPKQRSISNIEELLKGDLMEVYPDILVFLYELYAELLDDKGLDKKAKEALQVLIKLQRKRMNKDNQRVLQQQAVRFGLFKKEKELIKTKMNHKLEAVRWRNYLYIIILYNYNPDRNLYILLSEKNTFKRT